tara:strand:+ start:4594 stop:4842 length:249 start_codon:yes stop_codon:yes gene_type:complete
MTPRTPHQDWQYLQQLHYYQPNDLDIQNDWADLPPALAAVLCTLVSVLEQHDFNTPTATVTLSQAHDWIIQAWHKGQSNALR